MKFNTICLIIVWAFLSLQTTSLHAQSPFKAGVSIGVNLAQIDGDHQFGYDKKGFGYGIRGGVAVRKNFDIMTELLYVQKGASPKSSQPFDSRRAEIELKYAEVPLLFSYHFKKNELGFYKWTIQAGASYGRLLKSTSVVTKKSMLDSLATVSLSQENYKKTDISFIIGLTYNIRSNLGINVRHSVSLTTLYDNPDFNTPTTTAKRAEKYMSFRNYFLSFQIYYDFIAPKIKKPKKKKV